MEKGRLEESAIAAQIERHLLFIGLRLEAELPLPARQILGERHLRHGFIDLADLFADDQPLLDEAEENVLAMAEGCERSILHFAQARNGIAPHRGQAYRQTC